MALALAAVLEAWITPSPLPDAIRIGMGAIALFVVYVGPLLIGRRLTLDDRLGPPRRPQRVTAALAP